MLKLILPLSDFKNLELDWVGRSVFNLIDGRRTVEDIIDAHMERWHLSFFESRAGVMQFLRDLVKRGVVALLAPAPEGAPPGRG